MIFVGHDATAWHDLPPRISQIEQYVAVDATLKRRFVEEHQIPAELVRVVPDPIDLRRFQSRGALPARPLRALQFSSYSGQQEREELRAACDMHGIQLDGPRAFGLG